MRIIKLRAENFKRLRAVTITPDGDVVQICGRNGQGKTSTLDAIWAALGGKRACPDQPIRQGEKSAKVTVDLGDFVITRKFTAKGTQLEVLADNGAKYPSPQAILDGLVGELSFDPQAFARTDAKAQAETLRELVGLDLSALDRRIAGVYEERKDANRECKRLEGALDTLPVHDGEPKPVVLDDLFEELERLQQGNLERERGLTRLSSMREQSVRLTEQVASINQEIEELESRRTGILNKRVTLIEEGKVLQRETEAIEPNDLGPVREQISNAETTNRQVGENRHYADTQAELAEAQELADSLTQRLDGMAEEKAEQIASADYPIEGLALTDGGVTYREVPFDQASSAEQLRISAAIGLALNPKLRVLLIRDGSLLDAESMELLAKMAAEADGQLWIERVGDEGDVGVVIEDGEVQEQEAAR